LEKKIKFEFLVDDVNVGDDFSIVTVKDLTRNNLLMIRFQLSKDDQFEILSNNNNTIKNCITKEKFDTSDNKGIKQVGCFGNRILVLTNNNSLYMKGILYDMSNATEFKKCAKFNENILYFTLGINNCLLLSEENVIYAIGHNEYKEFGIPDEEQIKNKYTIKKSRSKLLPEDLKKSLMKTNGNINDNYNEKIFVNNFFKERGLTIQKVSTGARHSMVLCTNGELYCFGDNSDGQCSGFEKIVDEPTLIEFEDEDEIIIDIKAGFNHSIAKGLSKKVYVWGDSTWGKIGIKESTIDQFDPLEINDMKIRNVINMFAGPMHSGFFTSGDFNLEI
jgi:alpha-tubulin suppressor-like RCC1 family protein